MPNPRGFLSPVATGARAPSNNGMYVAAGDPSSLVPYLAGQRMLTEDLRWQNDATCQYVDPERFFAEGPGGGPEVYAEAKRICRGCPVIGECLAYAVRHGITTGLWGGLTKNERKPWQDAYEQAGGIVQPFYHEAA